MSASTKGVVTAAVQIWSRPPVPVGECDPTLAAERLKYLTIVLSCDIRQWDARYVTRRVRIGISQGLRPAMFMRSLDPSFTDARPVPVRTVDVQAPKVDVVQHQEHGELPRLADQELSMQDQREGM